MDTREQRMEYWIKILLERVQEANKKSGDNSYPITFELPLVRLAEIVGVNPTLR